MSNNKFKPFVAYSLEPIFSITMRPAPTPGHLRQHIMLSEAPASLVSLSPESEPIHRRSEGVYGDGPRDGELRLGERGLHVAADLHTLRNVRRGHLRNLHEALDLKRETK